jgi:AraC family transcriptional regulator of arabinose operon
MPIPRGATSYCPPIIPLRADEYRGRAIRHTFRPRGTRDWLLIQTVGGSGLYRGADGTEFRSKPGDVTVHRPHTLHDYQFAPDCGRWDLVWAHFLPRADWMAWLDWPEILPGLLRLNLHDPALRRRVATRMREVIAHYFSPALRAQEFGLNALEEVLLWCDTANPHRKERPRDARIEKALELLSFGMTEPFSERRIAGAVGLSSSRFRHLFRDQVGDSARNFHEQLRLRRARDLLAMSGWTVAEVADELGFASPFYFTLRFKKHTGQSPRAFRQAMAAPPRATPPRR